MDSIATRYGLDESLKTVQTTVAGQRLLMLDDLWTDYLGNADPDDRATLESDLPTLRSISEELQFAIEDLARKAEELRSLIESATEDQVNEAYGSVVSEYTLVADYSQRLPELLPDYDLRGAIIEACIYFQKHATEAQLEIKQKLQSIETGDFARGDIPRSLRCAGYLLVVGAGVGAAICTGGSALPIGLGIASSVGGGVFGWGQSGCSEVLSEIGGRRR